jgi:hypothetical protein
MFAPEQKLTVTLPAAAWNIVLAQVSEGPFRVVSQVLADMRQQLLRQQGEGHVVPFPEQPEKSA